MSELTVMILCGRSPRHLYVANKLCQATRPLAIVQEVGSQWNGKKIAGFLKPGVLWRKIWRWLRDRKRYTGDKEAKFFFGEDTPRLHRSDLLHEVPHINHEEVARLADRLRPDVIAVFGTSLIREPLLHKGKLGMVNLHGGLSPDYRGADCTFWALYNGQPEQVGCTLHFIDAGIDTGKLIAHVSPEIKDDDDELTLFWRAVRDSADVYSEFFTRLAAGERFQQAQSGKGRLYMVKHRTWTHERDLARRMQNGLLRNVRLPKRVRWFSATRDAANGSHV